MIPVRGPITDDWRQQYLMLRGVVSPLVVVAAIIWGIVCGLYGGDNGRIWFYAGLVVLVVMFALTWVLVERRLGRKRPP